MISRRGLRTRRGQTKDVFSRGIRPYEGLQLWLEGFLGFKPRMVMFRVDFRLIALKFSRLSLEECGQCPFFAFALQLRKSTEKISVREVNSDVSPRQIYTYLPKSLTRCYRESLIVGTRSEVIKLLYRTSWVVNMSVTWYLALLNVKLPSLLQSLLCNPVSVASVTILSIQPADAPASPKTCCWI